MTVGELPVIRPSIKLTDISVISRKPLHRYYRQKLQSIIQKHEQNRKILE